MQTNRRNFLKFGTMGAALATGPAAHAFAKVCGLTPPQTPGPFYPGEAKFTHDSDLTQIQGNLKRALGQVIYVQGQVQDENCAPVAGANVEIWQACASGRYNNSTDTNTAALDPNFKYWGEVSTDASGRYTFKTIVPGAYPADTDWIRPPHIHFKISKLGFRELITQMYFAGNPYNDKDLILHDVPAADRDRVVVTFTPVGPDLEPGALKGQFDIAIRSVRS